MAIDNSLLRIYCGLIWITHTIYVGGFLVEPASDVIKPIENDYLDNQARFLYKVNPWPPPCSECKPNNDDLKKYIDVELTFRQHLSDGTNRRLCNVKYHQGELDANTGNCTLLHPRMEPFSPLVGSVLFELNDVNYTTDQGRYSMLVEYGDPDIESNIDLDIQVAPVALELSKEPDQETYAVGDQVTLTCGVRNVNPVAVPPADMSWTRGPYEQLQPHDWKEGSGYDDPSWVAVERTLVRGDQSMPYTCRATNHVGSGQPIVRSVSLNVQYLPEVTVQPCGHPDVVYHVEAGNNALFSCEVDANPLANLITWHKGTKDGPSEELTQFNNESAILIRNVNHTEPNEHYWCQGTNTNGRSESSCQLDVQYGAKIELPESVTVKEGGRVSVVCETEANPPVTAFSWRRVADNVQVSDTRTLTLEEVGPDHAGGYECQATNVLTPGPGTGNARPYTATKTLDVHVQYKGRAHQYAVWKFGAVEKDEAVLSCNLRAYPDVTFQWKFNNQILTSNGERTIASDGQHSSLTIHIVKNTDFGTYECSANNTEGTARFDAEQLTPGRPDGPMSCETDDITDNDVTMRCFMGYNGGEQLFFYAERKDGKKRRKVELSATIPNITTWSSWAPPQALLHLQGLPPDTNHTLYIYQENKHGRSKHSLEIYAKTKPGSPVEPPRDDGLQLSGLIGAVLGAMVGFGLLVALAVYVFWKYGDEGCAGGKSKEDHVPYTIVRQSSQLQSDVTEDEEGHQNSAYSDNEYEKPQRQSAVENEYVKVTGLTKQQPPPAAHQQQAQNYQQQRPVSQVQMRPKDPNMNPNNRRSRVSRPQSEIEAYKLREGQSNLAGMGALSHYSKQNLANDRLELQDINIEEENGARPKRTSQRVVFSDHSWEIPREKIQIQKKLGEGAFGEVWKALGLGILGRQTNTMVAVKFLRANTPVEEHRALLGELEVMKQLKPHVNVITLLGCCTNEEPLYIIMEYASNGNLQQFLRDSRAPQKNPYAGQKSQTLTARDLTVFALHVAGGMEYIASKQFLHRDLAARNILLDSQLTCKISDFGLARDIINTRQYESKTQRRLPIRWMAPESLFDSIYSSRTDVWSFGILLWEIVTLGSTPYPGMSGADIMELIKMDYRMDKPTHCSVNLYQTMRDCWNDAPNRRPSFTLLRKQLESQLWELERDPAANIKVAQMRENMFDYLQNQPGEKC